MSLNCCLLLDQGELFPAISNLILVQTKGFGQSRTQNLRLRTTRAGHLDFGKGVAVPLDKGQMGAACDRQKNQSRPKVMGHILVYKGIN